MIRRVKNAKVKAIQLKVSGKKTCKKISLMVKKVRQEYKKVISIKIPSKKLEIQSRHLFKLNECQTVNTIIAKPIKDSTTKLS